MTDLEILIKFRQAEAAGTIHALTEYTHDCTCSNCDHCIAEPACRAVTDSGSHKPFYKNYRNWAKRTTFYDLPYLQQHYPELII